MSRPGERLEGVSAPVEMQGAPVPAGGPASLADILERVLDKGIVIAGDIRINLLDIELLTIKVRLLVASVDKAREIGITWWESDRFLTSGEDSGRSLEQRLERLEEAAGLGQEEGGEAAAESERRLEGPEGGGERGG